MSTVNARVNRSRVCFVENILTLNTTQIDDTLYGAVKYKIEMIEDIDKEVRVFPKRQLHRSRQRHPCARDDALVRGAPLLLPPLTGLAAGW